MPLPDFPETIVEFQRRFATEKAHTILTRWTLAGRIQNAAHVVCNFCSLPGAFCMLKSTCVDIFLACVHAKQNGKLIERRGRSDKEFHFQDWFAARLAELKINFDPPARNMYPDFRIVGSTEGYEIKGLGYPGRKINYDCNSQVPRGEHNGRTIFYLFGRYPANADESTYPVIDLVMCHGDFLNADRRYVHANKNIKGFGSYGDIMIRDRKMYVAPTPFALTEGTTQQATLILPEILEVDSRLAVVGHLVRKEVRNRIAGYTADLVKNTLTANIANNSEADKLHRFTAFRHCDTAGPLVSMKRSTPIVDSED